MIADCVAGEPLPLYDGGRVDATPVYAGALGSASGETIYVGFGANGPGCPKHCSFCSVWRTDGQVPRQRGTDVVVQEIVELRRLGFRFIALADDNFYPVTLEDFDRRSQRKTTWRASRTSPPFVDERFELMAQPPKLPQDMVLLYTDHHGSGRGCRVPRGHAGRRRIKGALVGVESVTPEGLKAMFKDFNASGR